MKNKKIQDIMNLTHFKLKKLLEFTDSIIVF